jgi:lipopolysaccharide transport system permease protein
LKANLISRVYFPRLIVPTATVVVDFVDFLITFAMLVVLMHGTGSCWAGKMLALPGFVILAFVAPLCGSPRSMSSTEISAT